MTMPQHIAIIPDGNRRWAKAHLFNPWDGHTEGVKRFWDIGQAAFDAGITHLTFWAASYGNLQKRSAIEVNFLLKLLREELSKPEVLEKMVTNKTQLQVVGEWKTLVPDEELQHGITHIETETKQFTDRVLTILFGYDGQREMLTAIKQLGHTTRVTEEKLRDSLWTGHLPDVDLVIRTGGEPHWSAGFMMWLTANSQFYFIDTLWPDFTPEKFTTALEDYTQRERRLGK